MIPALTAYYLRMKYLQFKPPIDPVTIAREEGYEVLFSEFGGVYSTALGFIDINNDVIYVNRSTDPQTQSYVIAHELGNSIFNRHTDWARLGNAVYWDRDIRNRKHNARNRIAREFALGLIAPRGMVRNYADRVPSEDLSKLFVVPNKFLTSRI